MSLHILHSNRVERLIRNLADQMARPPVDSGLLSGERVLLDNPTLGKWINIQLAIRNSVAANIRYSQLSEFFWQLARRWVDERIPRRTPLDKQEMTWRLLALLEDEDLLADSRLRPVRRYLAGDDFRELKRYQLAACIADLYDQYLIYRPDWINDCWDRGREIQSLAKHPVLGPAAEWQQLLWQKMTGSLRGDLRHRAEIFQRLLQKLEGADAIPGLSRLFVFGVTSMPANYIDMLMLLGRSVEINLYVLNPCKELWFDVRSEKQIVRLQQRFEDSGVSASVCPSRFTDIGNPLLASQGGQLREYIELLYDRTDAFQLHAGIEDFADFVTPGHDSLLASLQTDILNLRHRGRIASLTGERGEPRELPAAELDSGGYPSIHIHNCHSPRREVEVLHDQLLDLFARDPEIKPRDVVVMMPKVADYAACIEAIFAGSEHNISYLITDRSIEEESPLLRSFDSLLGLADSRLPLSEVLGLLKVPALRRRFGLDRQGFEQLRSWLLESGARWGLDAGHREQMGLPAYADFSWDFGLDRMFAGYAMTAEWEGNDVLPGVGKNAELRLPLDLIEGNGSDNFDGFLRFWNMLTNWRERLKKPRLPGAWADLTRQLLEDFYQPDADDWRALNELRRVIAELDSPREHGWYESPLGIEVIRTLLRPALRRPGSGGQTWGEGVKFCSLLPMRGVPFKVVYLLGMNIQDYPRRPVDVSFDLTRDQPRAGDRSARGDDRWLFLEALLSARRAFYVSYVGQDIHRNEAREPSSVLSELIACIRDGYTQPESGPFQGRNLVNDSYLYTRHPLQMASPDYFDPRNASAPRKFSFDQGAWRVVSGRAEAARGPGSSRWQPTVLPDADQSIELEDLIVFFCRPWDWFFSSRGVSLNRYTEQANDEDLFAPEVGLGTWKIRNQLLERIRSSDETASSPARQEREIDRLETRLKAAGEWPLGAAGEKLRMQLQDYSPEYLFALAGRQPEIQALELTIPVKDIPGFHHAVTLRGSGELYEERLICQFASKVSWKYLLEFFIRLAAARLERELAGAEAIFPADSKKGVQADFKFQAATWPLCLSAEQIATVPRQRGFLGELVGLYLEFRHSGLPLLPELIPDLEAENLELVLDKAWRGSGRTSGVRDILKQRAYFGSFEAFSAPELVAVVRKMQVLIAAWLGSTGVEK